MIQLLNIHYEIGPRVLIADVTWAIDPGKRYALVGANGAGKTTLLRLLCGELTAQSGQVIKAREDTIGYLPQETEAQAEGTLLEFVLSARADLLQVQRRIHDLRAQIDAEPEVSEEQVHKLGDLEHQFEEAGGYRWESEAREILAGLGFKVMEFGRLLSELSGGWRMRAILAGILLKAPDLLLLDEPTNHLDLEALEWLERYLQNFRGSIVLVSHDRFFIDRLANEIVEIERGQLARFSGHYGRYLEEKKEREEQLVKKREQIRAEKERLQRFIDRFRYQATKAAQVQSRVKMLEKLQDVELPPPAAQLDFRLPIEKPSYKDVLTVSHLSFRYDSEWVLEDIDFELFRGQKVAIVGPNGAGKTTFTRLIHGELTAQEGELRLGKNTLIGYYAQHQVDALDLHATVYDEVAASAAAVNLPRVRDILGIFQFHGDDVFKPIGVLSGGEKARVSLARMLMSPVNFLIMDEPTNHLDIRSRMALEDALIGYDGTLLLISHDRYFLDRIVTRVVQVRDKRLTVYEGNYSDYLPRREAHYQLPVLTESSRIDGDAAPSKKNKDQKRREAAQRQAISGERRKLESAIAALERQIVDLEDKQSVLESRLADPRLYQSGEDAANTHRDYIQVKQELQECLQRWEAESISYEMLLTSLKMNEA